MTKWRRKYIDTAVIKEAHNHMPSISPLSFCNERVPVGQMWWYNLCQVSVLAPHKASGNCAGIKKAFFTLREFLKTNASIKSIFFGQVAFFGNCAHFLLFQWHFFLILVAFSDFVVAFLLISNQSIFLRTNRHDRVTKRAFDEFKIRWIPPIPLVYPQPAGFFPWGVRWRKKTQRIRLHRC